MSDQQTLAMLESRRIEAGILKHVYETLKASHGVEIAKSTIADSVRQSAMEQARQFAAAVGGNTSLADLHRPPGAVDARRRARDAK